MRKSDKWQKSSTLMQQQCQYPTIGTVNNLPPQRCKIYPSRPLRVVAHMQAIALRDVV